MEAVCAAPVIAPVRQKQLTHVRGVWQAGLPPGNIERVSVRRGRDSFDNHQGMKQTAGL